MLLPKATRYGSKLFVVRRDPSQMIPGHKVDLDLLG